MVATLYMYGSKSQCGKGLESGYYKLIARFSSLSALFHSTSSFWINFIKIFLNGFILCSGNFIVKYFFKTQNIKNTTCNLDEDGEISC